MARFYARFDSGSGGWVSGLDSTAVTTGFFRRLRITDTSASAALLRNGLIASRSALSADIYADLNPVNEDPTRGTYFPPDSGPLSTNSSTFISWSTAYTSSIEGIKSPTQNTYGGAGTINYSSRPTASVLSTNTFVTASSPLNPVGASYNTYLSASNAVRDTLQAIQEGGVATTPYSRTGNNSARTFHSIWHDPDLNYFAWDDFTPGKPPDVNASYVATNLSGTSVRIAFMLTASSQYPNDYNQLGSASLTVTLRDTAGQLLTATSSGNANLTRIVPISDFVDGTGTEAGKKAFRWEFSVKANATASNGGNLTFSASFYDPIINTSQGLATGILKNTGATDSSANPCYFRVGSV